MRAGAVLDGVIALVIVVVIGKNGCCDRIVTLNVWRLVPGTTTNVQLVEPDVVGSASRSIVIVPVQTPSRKDREPDGPVGVGSRPHAESPNRRNAAVAW